MPDQLTITLPDGSTKDLPKGATSLDVAASIGRGLAKAAVAATVDGELVDLNRPLDHDATVAIVTANSDAGREVLRHSTSHLMAQAVFDLFPGAKYAIGPSIADGFYYDFELPDGAHFSDADLERIEARMREIVKEDQPFVRDELDSEAGKALFADQPYKVEIIERVSAGAASGEDTTEVAGDGNVGVYRNVHADGSEAYVDLCRGPHVPSTGKLGAFKLTKVAGAYWRGDEKRPMLQRIYGTAWESNPALAEHLHRLEEAERRDHRKLGVELDLFSFPEEIGSGLAVFHPKGGIVRKVMEDYSRSRHEAAGYDFVNSPHITKKDLFEISGHLDWFADGMYPPMELDGGTEYYLKPMNCPFHILIYRSRTRSYRELPLRLFEFGTVYRYEKSGVVHGLTRVRGMTQDDAHIFCAKEQMGAELRSLLDFVLDVLRDYGLDDFYLELSTKPEGKAVGTDEEWDEATEALRQHCRRCRARAGDGRGRRRVLRPEDLRADPRRDRSHVADVDDPARLPAPAALRPPLHGRRQRAAPADHDPPGALRNDRTLLRDHARALRRCVPALARAGPGEHPPGRRPPRALRLRHRRSPRSGGVPGRDPRRARRHARRARPQGQDRQDPLRAGRRRRRCRARDRRRERARGRRRRSRRVGRRLHRPTRSAPPRQNVSDSIACGPGGGRSTSRVSPHDRARGVCLFEALAAMDDDEAMILERTDHTFTVMNAFPYTSGHVMAVPARHVVSIIDLDADEAAALMHATQRATAAITAVYAPQGLNVGMNIGEASGAGVPGHLHVHVLPRWNGDTNFMTAVAETRVLPEPLRHSYEKLRAAFAG